MIAYLDRLTECSQSTCMGHPVIFLVRYSIPYLCGYIICNLLIDDFTANVYI